MSVFRWGCVGGILIVLGCAGAGETPAELPQQKRTLRCDAISTLSVCIEYPTAEAAAAGCAGFKGTVAEGFCPTEGLTGSCAHDGKVRKYYRTGGSPQGPSYAQKHCQNAMKGTFIAAP